MRLRSPASVRADARADVQVESRGWAGAGFRAESGSVTAEFAVALPAVVGVLALCLGAVGAVSTHTILTSLAVDSARVWARGEPWEAVQARVVARQPRATAVGTERPGMRMGEGMGERCVSLSMPLQLGSWIQLGVTIEESACAPIEP